GRLRLTVRTAGAHTVANTSTRWQSSMGIFRLARALSWTAVGVLACGGEPTSLGRRVEPLAAGGYAFTSFDYPGAVGTLGQALNERGMMGGWATEDGNRYFAWMYDGAFRRVDLPHYGGVAEVNNLNSRGVFVGDFLLDDEITTIG